jgi:hypothetical protein
VVVSIPPRAYPAVPVEPLAGKPVLDTINYIPQRDGRIPGLGGSLSSSEVLQRHGGSAQVVKVFNNITFWHLASLARPAGAADRSALPIAGDGPAAKAAVTEFLDAIGTTPSTPVRSAPVAAASSSVPACSSHCTAASATSGVPRLAWRRSATPSAPDGDQRVGQVRRVSRSARRRPAVTCAASWAARPAWNSVIERVHDRERT